MTTSTGGLGQGVVLRGILGTFRAGRVAHAHVLAGPDGIGKATLARAVASALLCAGPRREEGQACGDCAACRAVARGSHPAVTWIDPTGPLRIDDTRRLGRAAALAPHSGPCSVFVLEGAERLTGPAAVALLKTLEDPPGPLVALLLAEHPDQIEPTLRSRCLVARLRPVPVEELAAWLAEVRPDAPSERRAAAVRGARGLPGLALRLLDAPEAGPGDEDFVAALTAADPARAAAALAAAGADPARMLELLRDACLRSLGLDGEVAPCSGASPECLTRLQAVASPRALAAAGGPCLRAAEAATFNVSAPLNWHVLVHRLRAVRPPC